MGTRSSLATSFFFSSDATDLSFFLRTPSSFCLDFCFSPLMISSSTCSGILPPVRSSRNSFFHDSRTLMPIPHFISSRARPRTRRIAPVCSFHSVSS